MEEKPFLENTVELLLTEEWMRVKETYVTKRKWKEPLIFAVD